MHHDAITGTSLQATVSDYMDQFSKAAIYNTFVYEDAIGDRIKRQYQERLPSEGWKKVNATA